MTAYGESLGFLNRNEEGTGKWLWRLPYMAAPERGLGCLGKVQDFRDLGGQKSLNS